MVLERDGVVRQLLVAQIERAGALCYPSDDLKSALRLLAAEPRVRSVVVDFALADGAMASWVAQIRAERPDVQLVGTGGVGAVSERSRTCSPRACRASCARPGGSTT